MDSGYEFSHLCWDVLLDAPLETVAGLAMAELNKLGKISATGQCQLLSLPGNELPEEWLEAIGRHMPDLFHPFSLPRHLAPAKDLSIGAYQMSGV